MGKLVTPMATLPFLLPIHRSDEGELFVDACLTTHAEAVSFLASPALFYGLRAAAGALVEWLREILPGKTTAELYTGDWLPKHTKTEKVIGNTCTTFPAAMSNLLKRRGSVEW